MLRAGLTGLLLFCLAMPAWAQAPAEGGMAPTQLGTDREGKIVDLSEYRGKVVIVTFWASWCGYCLKELPVLNSLQHLEGGKLLKTIAVNVEDPPDVYRQMMRQMKGFELVQARDRDGGIAKSYGVKAYPNLWIIDFHGRIASHHVGYGESSLQTILDEIKRILTEELERQQAAAAS